MLVNSSSNLSQINKSKKTKKPNTLKNTGYTLYYKSIGDGMKTRSGKIINCILNNKEFSRDITYILTLLKVVTNPCVIIDNVCRFIDKYYEIMYKEKYLIKLHYEFNRSLSGIDNLIVKMIDEKISGCWFYIIKPKISPALNIRELPLFINMNHKCSEQHNIIDTLKKLRKYKLKYLPYHSTHKFIYKSLVYRLNEDCVKNIFEYI